MGCIIPINIFLRFYCIIFRVERAKLRTKNIELMSRLENVWSYLKQVNEDPISKDTRQQVDLKSVYVEMFGMLKFRRKRA